MPKVKAPPDTMIGDMDNFAKELMSLAKGTTKVAEDGVALQTQLDVFRQLAAWVAIKHRIQDSDGTGEDLDDLKRRLGSAPSTPRAGKARGPVVSGLRNGATPGDPFVASNSRFNRPDGHGGSALDAIRRALPSANARNNDSAVDDSER